MSMCTGLFGQPEACARAAPLETVPETARASASTANDNDRMFHLLKSCGPAPDQRDTDISP